MTRAFRPSPFHFTSLRELPFLARGRPYYVQSIFEGRTGMMFVLADFPSFSWSAALFAPCNDASLDGLREALTWIEPNFRAREEGQLKWDQRADDLRRIKEQMRGGLRLSDLVGKTFVGKTFPRKGK